MEIVTFEVPGNPVPQSRPRFTRQGHAYEYKKVKAYKECVRTVAASKMRGRPPMDGAVIASLKFLLPVPKSWSRKKRTGALAGEILPTSRPDTDNLTKTVLDACKSGMGRTRGLLWSFEDEHMERVMMIIDVQKNHLKKI